MRLLLISLLTASFLNADEINRFQEMLKHTSELKSSYTKCQNDLEIYERLLEEERVKNKELLLRVEDKDKIIEGLKKDLETDKQTVLKIKETQNPIVETFKPSSFRLKEEADIYSVGGVEKVDRWEAGRSFTSNAKIGSFIKITGYFIDKKWQNSKKELWIKSDKVIKRD